MKTPLQKLISKWTEVLNTADLTSEESFLLSNCIVDAEDLLDEEKDAIKEAHLNGFTSKLIPEEYYNRKYNPNTNNDENI